MKFLQQVSGKKRIFEKKINTSSFLEFTSATFFGKEIENYLIYLKLYFENFSLNMLG